MTTPRAYRYRAAREDGRIIRGWVEAENGSDASTTLVERGLHPIQVRLSQTGQYRRAASRRDLSIAFRSIAALTAAGVPLERALKASEALAKGALRETLAEARTQLRAGRTLAQGLETSHGVIPPVVIGILGAGERGGRLRLALEEVANHMEREADLLAKIRQALAYPILLSVAGICSVLLIGTVVLPKFATLLADLGQELPPTTRFLLMASTLVSRYGLISGLGVVGAIVLFVRWIRSPGGGLQWDRRLLDLPLLGPVRLALISARVSSALSGMLKAGMPLLSALDAVQSAAGDRAVIERIQQTRERVAQGETLAGALMGGRVLSQSAIQLIAVGESSGQLPEMTARAGDLSRGEAERGIQTLVSLLEPSLVVLFGGLVAFVAAALLQAVYSIRVRP